MDIKLMDDLKKIIGSDEFRNIIAIQKDSIYDGLMDIIEEQSKEIGLIEARLKNAEEWIYVVHNKLFEPCGGDHFKDTKFKIH